jgi:hypothetical protein
MADPFSARFTPTQRSYHLTFEASRDVFRYFWSEKRNDSDGSIAAIARMSAEPTFRHVFRTVSVTLARWLAPSIIIASEDQRRSESSFFSAFRGLDLHVMVCGAT